MAAKRRQLVKPTRPQQEAVTIGSPPTRVEALRIEAKLHEGLAFRHPPQLDALLEWSVCERHGYRIPPAAGAPNPVTVVVPLADSECGRFRMCSAAIFDIEESETRHKHRRAPWVEFARLGSNSIRRVNIALAENKSYRVPYEHHLLRHDLVTWFALGDRDQLLDLLYEIHYLGRFRGSGKGRVLSWEAHPVDPWEGFPILREGQPLRPLPDDVAEADPDATGSFCCVRPPYWDHTKEVPCLIPSWW